MTRTTILICIAMAIAGCNGAAPPPQAAGAGFGMGGLAMPTTAGGQAGAQVGAGAGGTTAGGAATATAVIATGPDGRQLTRDAAEAYMEAFQFVLGEIGRPKTFTASEKEQLIQALAKEFPKLPEATRKALVDARATWTSTRAGWPAASAQAKQQFVQDVLVIGVGEQAAAQLTGQATATATAGRAGGEDSWTAEAREKCENGSFEDKMFYCHGVQVPSHSPW